MMVVMLQVLGLVLEVSAFVLSFMIQESAGHNNPPSLSTFPVIPSVGEGKPSFVSNSIMFFRVAPTPLSQPTGLEPQLIMPPPTSVPVPQMANGLLSSTWSNIPSVPPSYLFASSPKSVEDSVPAMPRVPRGKPHHSAYPPITVQAPASITAPQNKETLHPSASGYMPQNFHQSKRHDNDAPLSPVSPEKNRSSILTPPPSIIQKTAPVPGGKTVNPPVSHSETEDPAASKPLWCPNGAPAPHPLSKSTPWFYSPKKHLHARDHKITSAPLSQIIPPASSKQEANHRHKAPSSTSADPFVSPKKLPSGSSPRHPLIPPLPPLQRLPSPPPNKDCAPLTCTEPLTYGDPESSCVCVLPIQVGLRLTVVLYTFFPLVSELAAEVAAGVFMKQSQVRIIGANAAGDNPEKTIVLIDLVPLREKFVHNEVYLTFQRFWHKQVVIKPSFFGDYDVLYVRYPGLPPSPPSPPSAIGIIGTNPYGSHDNNARTMQPLAVDVRRKHHGNGLSRSILATIIFSAFAAIVLLSAMAWVLVLKTRGSVPRPDRTPATILPLAKSSGMQLSMAGSGPSSPSFSLGSSIAAYTGSARTFSSIDVERATDYFSEARILGEGGFGRVYSGVLEDGTRVAIKIIKRYDQQGGREFMAEVNMLSRLHHRNLVKLIGICVENRTRCLIYELIPNGSLESHLHGLDKENAPLNWSARLKIAVGAARALAYLHEDSSPRVIHRDFKASNILLEDDFTPKVSDFGLARTALDEENKHISTRVVGTFGYVAPEYAMTGHLLVKSDVYSYGVVLLELLTGRKPVDMSQPPGQENLVSWARPLLTSREGLESIMDATLGPDFPFDSFAKVAAIASMCVQTEVSDRPFMGEVVQALQLVLYECNEMKELLYRNSSQEDLPIDMEARKSIISDQLSDHLITHSPVHNYHCRLDIERDLSTSDLLSSSAKFGWHDSENFRRHSSSGPLRTSKAKRLWKMMRQLSGSWDSMSEHGFQFKLSTGSH